MMLLVVVAVVVLLYVHRNVLSRLCVGIYGFIHVFYCVGVALSSGPTFSFVYLLFYSVDLSVIFVLPYLKRTVWKYLLTSLFVCFCSKFGTYCSDCYHVSSFLLIPLISTLLTTFPFPLVFISCLFSSKLILPFLVIDTLPYIC